MTQLSDEMQAVLWAGCRIVEELKTLFLASTSHRANAHVILANMWMVQADELRRRAVLEREQRKVEHALAQHHGSKKKTRH